MNRRRGAIAVTALLLIGGFSALGTTGLPSTEVAADNASSSDAVRDDDASASRGAARTPDAAAVALQNASQSVELTAPADEADSVPAPAPVEQPAAAPVVTEAPATTVPPTTAPPTTAAPKPAPAPAPASKPAEPATSGKSESGQASYYSHKPGGCAHKTIAKGTTLTVTNTKTGATATCVVNDRGPFIAGRIVDLDITVFRQIASTSAGVAPVRITW